MTFQPCILSLVFTQKRTSVCRSRGCRAVREASCVGCWKPVAIVVAVFCTALYHESVNTVMSNLFITTDYWTRAQKRGSSYMWICLVKKGSWDSNSVTTWDVPLPSQRPSFLLSFLVLQVIAARSGSIRLCVGCQVTCPLDLDSCRRKNLIR